MIFRDTPLNHLWIAKSAVEHVQKYATVGMVKNFILNLTNSLSPYFLLFSNASWDSNRSMGGAGFYIADTNDKILIAGAGRTAAKSSLEAETRALILGLNTVTDLNLRIKHICIDCAELAWSIQGREIAALTGECSWNRWR